MTWRLYLMHSRSVLKPFPSPSLQIPEHNFAKGHLPQAASVVSPSSSNVLPLTTDTAVSHFTPEVEKIVQNPPTMGSHTSQLCKNLGMCFFYVAYKRK
ncbi:hypothetical protein Mapa_015827 [Marchantia paleacea]|nr:hypothetical protein Mapa_015827 [Marchantia paleacea]